MTKIRQDSQVALAHVKNFLVYGREECHLCQNMILALQDFQRQVPFEFETVNIDSNPELIALYGEKIPVLVSAFDNQEICHYFLNLASLNAYINEFS